ncbi:NUDIX domain-containing protein [Candidatus Woesearchaeota archaeon]|nr:NUDIX domain-containing protein [Candidatus Woesearchaeota archaeon]
MERPGVGLGVVIEKEGKIVLGKRTNTHGDEMWCCPGGHLELNERFEECAKREAKEETDMDIGEAECFGITNDLVKEWGTHYITICMKATQFKGKPKVMEPDKFIEVGWYPLDNLPKPLFPPTRKMIGLFKSGGVFNKDEQEA